MEYSKKSFSMYFGGGEIWFEHLDGYFNHSELVLKKLEDDYKEFKKPSKPSLVAINLDETDVTDELISSICEKLTNGTKRYTRVVFVGVNKSVAKKLKSSLFGFGFALRFERDFENAKEWLVSESL